MNAVGTAYATVRATLAHDTANAPWPSPEAGFLDYLQTTNGTTPTSRTLDTDRLDETPILASTGYEYTNHLAVRPSGFDDAWARQFRRLAQRQAFPVDRES